MKETIHDWDSGNFLNLAINDKSKLEKKLKHFLKNLFGSKSADAESSEIFGKNEVSAKLDDLIRCIQEVGKNKECKHFVSLTLDLFMGHSKIRQLLLETREEFKIRRKLVELFCLLCTCQIESCKERENLIDFILGSYDATLSIEDQLLLQLLSILESKGVNLQRYQPFIWGVNGVLFYASKHSQKLAFLKMPTIDEMFKGFEGKKLSNSLACFPISVKMPDSNLEILSSPELIYSNLYDPRFILPMFYHFLSSQSIAKCYKFITYGPLSYTIVALSSHCPRIRSIAYRVLSQLYNHLDCASYPQDRQLWLGLIVYLRTGLSEENQRLESVQTVFFVRMIDILLKPMNPLFVSVRKYLLNAQLKPCNLNSLPGFYRVCMHLVTASNLNTYYAYQKFAISFITDSLRTANDVRLCHRKNVFSDMLVLYNSPLCSSENKMLIMRLLIAASQLYEGIKVLCFDCAIFSWVKHLLITVPSIDISEETNKNQLSKLVVTIWETAFAEFGTKEYETESKEAFIFYKSFGFELVDVLSRILYKTNDKNRIDKFLFICDQILSHNTDELTNFNIRMNICSNLPLNLESMLKQQQSALPFE